MLRMITPLSEPIVNERGERLLAVSEGATGVDDVRVSIVLAQHERGVVLVQKCALYQCRAEGAPTPGDAEITAVAFWDPMSMLAPISTNDAAILRGGLRGCA